MSTGNVAATVSIREVMLLAPRCRNSDNPSQQEVVWDSRP